MDVITLDFETYYDSKYSLTKLTTMEYVKDERFKVWGVGIKINDDETEWYGEEDAQAAIDAIDWSNATLVCHNTPFDGYILTQYYGLKPKYYVDTAAMSRGLYPGQSARLKDVAIRCFPNDEKMRKGEELADAKGIYDLDPELEESIAGYCIQDVDLTYWIYQHMRTFGMPESEMNLIDLTCRMFCEPKLKIDRERLTTYRDIEIYNSEAAIAKSGIDRKVLSSNQQFAEYLYEIGLVPPTKVSPTTGKEIPALGKNDKAFKQMQKMYPQFQHIWDARKAVKSRINETRAQRFLDAACNDDYLPVPLRYYAAHTGRFGGTEKLNMQNLPRGGELRKCIVAPEGQLLYVADLSNIEARMLAWLAGEHELLQQFADGDDIYSNFASKIYERPINKHDDPVERFVGKTAILGLGYGMGANKFRETLAAGAMGPPVHFTLEEARRIVNTYRSTYSGIKTLWTKLEDLLKQTLHRDNFGNVYGPLTVGDRKLILPNGMALSYYRLQYGSQGFIYESRGKKEYTYGGRITENVIQALARIIITDSMLRLNKQYDVALTVHDEIIIASKNITPGYIMDSIIADMCIPPSWAPTLPLAAEGGYAKEYSK
jgi:DNA polymerase